MKDLEKALNYYRSALCGVKPDFVPCRVFLASTVWSDFPMGPRTYAVTGFHDCKSNKWGAISVAANDGKRLGIKPAEFEVDEWRENQP